MTLSMANRRCHRHHRIAYSFLAGREKTDHRNGHIDDAKKIDVQSILIIKSGNHIATLHLCKKYVYIND